MTRFAGEMGQPTECHLRGGRRCARTRNSTVGTSSAVVRSPSACGCGTIQLGRRGIGKPGNGRGADGEGTADQLRDDEGQVADDGLIPVKVSVSVRPIVMGGIGETRVELVNQ